MAENSAPRSEAFCLCFVPFLFSLKFSAPLRPFAGSAMRGVHRNGALSKYFTTMKKQTGTLRSTEHPEHFVSGSLYPIYLKKFRSDYRIGRRISNIPNILCIFESIFLIFAISCAQKQFSRNYDGSR